MSSSGPEPAGAPPRGRRRAFGVGLLAAALLAFAALVAGVWTGPRAEGEGARRAPDVASAPPRPPPPVPAPASPEEPLPEPIARFLAATPYPPTSGRLTERDEDLLRPNRRHEKPRPIGDTLGGDPSAVVRTLLTADRYYYTGDETLRATLDAWRDGAPTRLGGVRAELQPEGRAGAEGAATAVRFQPDGDGYRLEWPLAGLEPHHGPVVLRVRYDVATPDGDLTHDEEIRFFVTPATRIPARLTGTFDERLEAGSLVVDVGVDVDVAGFYRFDANLYDAAGEPVGWAAFKGELDTGDRAFALEFYGKVLHDAAASGPFVVRDVRGYRFLDRAYPDRERLPDSDLEFATSAWPLASWTAEPHVSEHELRMVELMREDLARGIGVDIPAPPADR